MMLGRNQSRSPVLQIVGPGDPHALEGGQGGQDRASNPRGEQALGGGGDPDLGIFWRQRMFPNFT